MQQMRAEAAPINQIVQEIERRRRVTMLEVIELAEHFVDNRGSAFELAIRAIVTVTKNRRVEIGFRY